jgi:hypothetical protein
VCAPRVPLLLLPCLFDLSSAVVSTLIAMTSLGFLACSAREFCRTTITLASTAFASSRWSISRGCTQGCISSHTSCRPGRRNSGWFMLMFFVFGACSSSCSTWRRQSLFHTLIPGLIIIACAMAAYFVV